MRGITMIEVKGLTKRFGNITAINNLNFSVKKGEVLGFLGPNGAGKTTTMRILTCFSPATEGTATIDGYDIFEDYMEIKKILGYLPEAPPLYLELTAREYLKYVAKIKGVPGSKIKNSIDNVVDKCGLQAVIDRVLGNLSKGYRQRVGLAQALINNPKLLILDEPTVGLDPKQIIEIRELIKALASEHTVILSTHILPEVTQTCQKIIILNEGNIIAEDTYEQLSLKLKKTNNVKAVVNNISEDLLSKLGGIPGVQSVNQDTQGGESIIKIESGVDNDVREEAAKIIVNSGCGLLELNQSVLSLEDVFLHLITKEEGV
jgi:ABC-2 type transport system ATP-binding protein